MRRKWVKGVKTCTSALLAASLVVTGMPLSGIQQSITQVKAATSAQDREDNSIVYFVDCGDLDVTTVSAGDQLGTHNSVTEQVYGVDSITGYKWGIDDTVSTPLKNGAGSCLKGGVSTDWTWPNEASSGDGLPKTSTNRYTKNQYEKEHNNDATQTRHLDYKFEIENGTYYVEVGCTDPWGCSKTPTVYANLDKDSQVVLADPLDVSAGQPASGSVTVTDGELTINLRASGATNLAINATYILIKQVSENSMLQTDYDSLSIKTTATSDITLPTEGVKGGSTITWKSSNPTVITDEGKVTRPEAGSESVQVTLTATLKNGDATMEKEFVVTVTAKSSFMGMSDFELGEVVVQDAYYVNSLEKEIDYLLKLDSDRLLAGFRETAGYIAGMSSDEIKAYMNNKTRYTGGWENALIGGHTLGHYLSAMAQAYANEGTTEEDKAAVKAKLDGIIDALADCQAKTKGTEYEGYLFGSTLASKTDFDIQFDNVEKNLTNISTQAWVPWYTMHKIVAGLISAYELTGNETAYEEAKALGDWIYNRVSKWSDATQKIVLGIEYGGMNDCLYDLYEIVKEKEGEEAANKYALAAHKFDEETLFKKIYDGNTPNAVEGTHANTTIPKFLGALNRYHVLGDETYLAYTESFWDYVLEHHSYITGGNSEWEHFGADDILDAERTNCNCETCNTYNMLKLTRQLYMITGDSKYSDYYENTLINAIMSSQNPETGMSMYFQPMATGYQKVFGTEETNFWCCTGSGMENFTKLNDSIYYQKDNTLVIAQYLASTVTWNQGNMKVTQDVDLTKSETATITVNKLDSTKEMNGNLYLRLPDWLADKASVTVGGTTYEYAVKDNCAVIPADKLADGTEITITLPMQVVAYNLPDGENTYAFKYGPYVLSAKLGTSSQSQSTTGVNVSIPTTKAVANDKVAIKSADTVAEYMENINNNMVKTPGKMEFVLYGTNLSNVFVPHYSQYKESYGIYWTFSVDEDARGSEAVLEEKNTNRVNDAITESARPGYGQDEWGFVEEGTGSVGSTDPCFRYANAGGSFRYAVEVTESGANYVVCTFAKEEDGKSIKISVGDTVIYEGILDSTSEDAMNMNLKATESTEYYQMRFEIPESVIAANKSTTRNVGTENQTAPEGYAYVNVKFESASAEEASAKICLMTYVMKAYKSENDIEDVTSTTGTVTKTGTTYTITVPYDKAAKAKFTIKDTAGYVSINGNAVDDSAEVSLATTGSTTTYDMKVYAQDFTSYKAYTLKVVLDYSKLDLNKNLVKYFSFNNTTNGAVAVTKSFTPAEKANATYTYIDGKVGGKALALDGSYGLKLLDNANALGESYTIGFWMNPTSVGTQFDPTVTAGIFNPEFWLNLTFDGKIWSKKDGNYIATESANAYKAGEWQYVALSVDGNTEGTVSGAVNAKLYVNGEVVSQGNIAKGIMTQSGAKLYFGLNAWDALFKGSVDEISVFNTNLSANEIIALMDNKVTLKESSSTNNNNNNSNHSSVTTKTYKITYMLNGGKNAKANPATYTSKQTVTLKNPTRKGYTFAGWYTTSKFTGKVTKVSGKNITVYAKWTKVTTANVKKVTVKALKGSKVKLTMKKVSGAKGYEVTYGTNKKITKNKKKFTTTKATYTVKNLKKGKTYYFKVRAYKLDSAGNKVYSKKYTFSKKVIVKK